MHVGVRVLGQPLCELAADPRQIDLAGRGPPKLAEQRVGQPGHELGAAAFHADQVHLLGRLEIAAVHQVAEHVDRERLVLRQRIDDQRHVGGEPAQLPTDHVTYAVRHRDALVPHPHPGGLPYRAGGDLVLEQLPQKQRVATRQFPEPLGAATIYRAAEHGLDHALGVRSRQRLEVQAGEQVILPQRSDRVGLFPARAHGDHQPCSTDLGQLVYDVCR